MGIIITSERLWSMCLNDISCPLSFSTHWLMESVASHYTLCTLDELLRLHCTGNSWNWSYTYEVYTLYIFTTYVRTSCKVIKVCFTLEPPFWKEPFQFWLRFNIKLFFVWYATIFQTKTGSTKPKNVIHNAFSWLFDETSIKIKRVTRLKTLSVSKMTSKFDMTDKTSKITK